MTPPTAIDLFAGPGGLTAGLKAAGFRVAAAVEIDEDAARAYRKNHPEVTLLRRDLRYVSGPALRTAASVRVGSLDLLAGCPPCQGFSTMTTKNQGKSTADTRNDLVFEFLRMVKSLRPRAVLMENVPGLAKDWRLEHMIDMLTTLGYETKTKIVNAADYGVPQRRRRMILIGGRGSRIPFPRRSRWRRTVRDAITRLKKAGTSGDDLHDHGEKRTERIRRLIAKIPRDGGSRSALPTRYTLECHKEFDGFNDVYGRMGWDQPAPTVTGGCFNPSKGRFLHPRENRAITLREAALLQSFPSDYWFPIDAGKEAVAIMIGNAVPPELAKKQARTIRSWLRRVF